MRRKTTASGSSGPVGRPGGSGYTCRTGHAGDRRGARATPTAARPRRRGTTAPRFAGSLGEAFALLEKDEADAVCYDDVLLSEQAAKSALGEASFVFFDRYLSVEPYGLMMRKDDPAFLKEVNAGLESIYASGEIHAVYAKWFLNGQRKVPMSGYLREDIAHPNSHPAFP